MNPPEIAATINIINGLNQLLSSSQRITFWLLGMPKFLSIEAVAGT
jgi:hypothetical protein